MSVSPAEPLSYAAAKLAFELDKVFTVFGAILNGDITASWTDKFLRFKGSSSVVGLVHGCDTIFSASKVRFLAFETEEVGIDDHSILLWFSKVGRCLVS